MPKRIRLSRAKGWRIPPNTVRVCRPLRWGNPYKVGGYDFSVTPPVIITDRQHAVDCWKRAYTDDPVMREIIAEEARAELAGKNLACWCPLDEPCHADLLLELANT